MSPLAAVLPGRAYPATGPALAGVVAVLERHGYVVRAARWSLTEVPEDPTAFVVAQLHALVPDVPDGADLVVAKSLGCWAAPYAARRASPAVWVTPVLTDEGVAAGIRDNPAPQLVLAGSADAMHDPDVARGLGCDVVELPGVDHAFSSTGDHAVAPAILSRLDEATDEFIRRHA